MGYQALLFCPDDKTARTVTQVLSELEFNVEACVETFAAVKKLMGMHFDAVVVDCDNEQNAALLFKSARNSTSNQTSLAVAVVEGQAGVAKAFRIGANLVLTKPINIEQAKGTLRVARGLLRKGEPVKPGASVPTPTAAAPAPPKPAATKPAPAKPATAVSVPKPPVPPPPPAKPAWPAQAAVASTTPAEQDDVLPEINVDGDILAPSDSVPVLPTAPAKPAAPAVQASKLPPRPVTTKPAAVKPAVQTNSQPTAQPSLSSAAAGGAASAVAPARETKTSVTLEASPASTPHESGVALPATGTIESHSAHEPPLPTFTFGGNATARESSGGSKKILIIAAVVVALAAAAYAGWNYFQGRASQPATPPAHQTPAPPSQPAPSPTRTLTENSTPTQPAPAATEPVGTSSAPASEPAAQTTPSKQTPSASSTDDSESAADDETPAPAPAKKSAPAPAKTATAAKPVPAPEPAPLVVKAGKVPATKPAADASADAQAPSMIGIATPDAGAPLPNLASSENSPKPVLQTMNVSQGVSQGLILKKVQPIYPRAALTMHIEGAVQLSATISKTGDVTGVKVISGDARLATAAVEAVKQWKYKPYLLDGEPIDIQTTITLNFKSPN